MTGAETHPADIVASYARRFLAAVPAGHGVTSPLGAWLLLALAAGSAEERAAADDLLRAPHPLVAAAVALWTADDVETPALADWRSSLRGAETGPVPTQVEADRWADAATDGLVREFPLSVDATTVLVLANALATRVRWPVPLLPVDAERLGGPLGDTVARALSTAYRDGQEALLVATAIGTVGVHAGESASGDDGERLLVVSVVAEDRVAPDEVHAAAVDVATLLAGRPSAARRVDVFDAPLAGHCWSIEEGTAATDSGVDRVVRADAVLPAWSAATDLDLLPGDGTAFGLDAAVAQLRALLPPAGGPYPAAARQSAVASFTRVGFEAAAVSAIGMVRAAPPGDRRQVPSRSLTVRFGRPYAVCAVALGGGAWHGVPVFSAWVAHADEVGEE